MKWEEVQYQEEKAPASTISPMAVTKHRDQKSMKRLYSWK